MRGATAIAVLALIGGRALAGAPFLTDDAVPVDYRRTELYFFATYSGTDDRSDINVPAIEYNYGVLPDLQVQVAVALAQTDPDGAPAEWGQGDLVIGAKYRVIDEADAWPQIAIAPVAVLPTGDADKGLGNGKVWWRLPFAVQKTWGDWTTYGGGGYVINRGAGQSNHAFGGVVLQKDIGRKWMLGGEVFARGRDTNSGRSTTVVDLGGSYGLSTRYKVLFSAGRSITGARHSLAYVGLWCAFGNGSVEKQASTSGD